MTPLARLLLQRIATGGPLSVADYMAASLGHREHGYYTTRDPLGPAGDFVTAPEVSQMFGELLGLWCAAAWSGRGHGAVGEPVNLVELGPGRGTLMNDALRALATAPALRDALRVTLVETSPALRAKQQATLAAHRTAGVPMTWCDTFADVPPGPLLLLANEFFDALPVHQFVRTDHGWHERVVTADAAGTGFAFAIGAPVDAAMDAAVLPAGAAAAPVGAITEARPAAQALVGAIAARIAAAGGAALIIDYGYATAATADTLQAVRSHGYAPVLAAPGDADLTAHVDFAALALAARQPGAATHGPVPQGRLLQRLGIEARASRLAATATDAQRRAIEAALRRLIASREMGTLFQALAITPPAADAPPGF